jgi:integrase
MRDRWEQDEDKDFLDFALDENTAACLEADAALWGRTVEEQAEYVLEVFFGLRPPHPEDEALKSRLRVLGERGERPPVLLLTPTADVSDLLAAAPCEQGAWTVGAFLDFYEQHHVAFLKNRVGTTRRLERYVRPLASVSLTGLKRLQVIRWYHEIGRTRGPGAANQALQQLHALYAKAADWETFTGRNPADRIKKFPKRSRTRFVQPHEMAWLLAALAEELPQDQTFFLWLLLTGARVGEARSMKWADLDLHNALWHKPNTKTNVPHTVPIALPLVDRLRQLPRVTEWVFSSQPNVNNGFQPGKWSNTATQHRWRVIRTRAGLPDIRIHDLRRTTASWLAIGGQNLSVIQQVLNHSSLMVTQVYARLTVGPVRRALDEQAERMLNPAQPLPSSPMFDSRKAQTPEWPG